MKPTNLQPLINLIATLRHPETGCPWDLEQSHDSLVSMTFEEMSELADAIVRSDKQNVCEELGDVLFHLVFYARIAEENGDFTMQDVIDKTVSKMIHRHPHIFEGKVYANEAEQKADWHRIKAEEKVGKVIPYPKLDAKQRLDSLPAIVQSVSMQKELAKAGFDWPDAIEVFDKIEEEIDEVKEEIEIARHQEIDNQKKIAEEFGDLLFAVINLGRKLDIDPDIALRKANHKFYNRSEAMIALTNNLSDFSNLSLDEKEALWNQVKQSEQRLK